MFQFFMTRVCHAIQNSFHVESVDSMRRQRTLVHLTTVNKHATVGKMAGSIDYSVVQNYFYYRTRQKHNPGRGAVLGPRTSEWTPDRTEVRMYVSNI